MLKLKKNKYILLTGGAGFIGFHVANQLIRTNKKIIIIDNMNNYYDNNLKKNRLNELKKIKNKKFIFFKCDLTNKKQLEKIFKKYPISGVINLAAQAGVRYSINNPSDYFQSNLLGFFNLLEVMRRFKVLNLVYASTSSVYGNEKIKILKENFDSSRPIQFYAATKKSNELIANAYSEIYNFKCIGLRYFTVYGPWGRPDMALFKFTKNILNNEPIEMFNRGNHLRDFTYVEDVAQATILAYKNIAKIKHEIFNIGKSKPNKLKEFVNIIEKNLIKKAKKKLLKLQIGDVRATFASNRKFFKYFNFKPKTDLDYGIQKFIEWYKNYYKK